MKSKNIWCSKQILRTCSIQNMIRHLRALLTPVTGTLLYGVRDGVWDSIGSVQYSKKSWLQMCFQICRIVKVFWHILVLSTPIFSSCGKRFSVKTKKISIHFLVMGHWHSAMNGKMFCTWHPGRCFCEACVNCGCKNSWHAWHHSYESFHLYLLVLKGKGLRGKRPFTLAWCGSGQ